MSRPYQIATLLYAFNERGEVLLMQRNRPPNQGLWSPCGGKLHTADGESPYACAVREAGEELGLELSPGDLHLAGLVSEHGYEGQSHWLMFLFEIKPKLSALPPPHPEGQFEFVPPRELNDKPMPVTDQQTIWPLFWECRGGFFSAHCRCLPNGDYDWSVEEKIKPARSMDQHFSTNGESGHAPIRLGPSPDA